MTTSSSAASTSRAAARPPRGPAHPIGLVMVLVWLLSAPGLVLAADSPPATDAKPERWAIHGQATLVDQGTLAFRSPYRGPNSLDPGARGRETFDVTLYGGVRPWKGAEIWIDPEIDQGFGLSNTLGLAGFPSGEAYKVGKSSPYVRLQRLFFRQTVNLGGPAKAIDPGLNQFGGEQTADHLTFTVGKFSVGDIFETNDYAHDPRHDFLNWSLIDAGSFDYAADAWGYSYGAAAEWYAGRWALRAGVFDLSTVPNSETLERDFSQFQTDLELEERHKLAGRPGRFAMTGFLSRGRMGRFADAIRMAQSSGLPADIAAVRRYRSRSGISFNLQQEIADGIGVFARGGVADSAVEPYEFSDIDRSIAAGASLNGKRWGRPADTFALAGAVNGISSVHQRFLDAGGLGILIGDGRLPRPGAERILETYYDMGLVKQLQVTFDYQFIENPAYNRDRGPVSVFALRLHGEF